MTDKLHFGLMQVDLLTLPEAVKAIAELAGRDGPSLVMTPNLHRYSLLASDDDVRAAYDMATLVLPDGWPIVSALRRRPGGAHASQVCGSDLLPLLLRTAASRGLSVALIGGMDPRASADAARRASPGLRVVYVDDGRYTTPPTSEQVERLVTMAEELTPDLVVLGLGAPKEEALALRVLPRLESGVVLCLGASTDFLSGHQRRAPGWVQRTRLEWAWRSFLQPSRLWHRYMKPLPAFVRAVRGKG